MNNEVKKGFFDNPLLKTKIKSANVKISEMFFGYLIGPIGALLASGIFTSFINYYWTDVLFKGQQDNIVDTFLTLLPLLSAILIVIGNLVVGQIIEKTKTSAGKARPWILLSSILLSLSCVFMFVCPSNDVVVKMVLTAISYNLYYSVAYPLYNTANSTLIPVSTRNASQRGLLASVTNVAGLAVMGAGSMVFPILMSIFLKTQISWTIAFIGVGILTFIACLLQYFFTRERVTEESIHLDIKQEKLSIGKQLKAVTSDKFWWVIIIFYLIFQFSGAIKNLSMVYFCENVVDNSFWNMGEDGGGMTQSLLSILGAIPMAVAVAIVWPLSNKFGKKNVTVVGMIIGVIGGIIAIIGGENVIPVAIGVALKCLGSAPACYMILAMISDSLDHIEAKRGYRCDGLTMSIYSSIMVAATPVCMAIFNGISALIADKGLVASISYVWIETIAYAVCGILLLFFTVEKNLDADQKEIIERQKEAVIANGGIWIEPAERLRLEQEEADRVAEEARIAESKERCLRKGLNFEEVEAAYQAKKAAKKAAIENKNAAKK